MKKLAWIWLTVSLGLALASCDNPPPEERCVNVGYTTCLGSMARPMTFACQALTDSHPVFGCVLFAHNTETNTENYIGECVESCDAN